MGAKLSLQDWIESSQQTHSNFALFCLKMHCKELQLSPERLTEELRLYLAVMEEAIETGLSGIRSRGGLVGGDSRRLADYQRKKPDGSLLGPVLKRAVTYALAVSEANAAMGRIVAAPTAGASGILPGVLFALKEFRQLKQSQLCEALTVAGTIGLVIASRASLSGAAGGCQAECGSGAAMAAGAAVYLLGGQSAQIGQAVAIVLKNMLGLVCDPVAGLVEVPCVKRNAGAVAQALTGAELALAGIKSVIPVDEVIDAMASVGSLMNCALKETAQGGLAITPTGLRLANKMHKT